MAEYFVVEPCATANAFEVRLKDRKLDLQKCEKALPKIGEVVGSTPVLLLAKIGSYSLSLYASGRMMIKGKKLDSKTAKKLAEKIFVALERSGAIL